MGIESNIVKFYVFKFISAMFFHGPIFVIYLRGYISLTQVMVLEVFAGFTTVILEIPSGAFADTYSLATSLLCSAAIVLVFSVMLFPFLKLNAKTI